LNSNNFPDVAFFSFPRAGVGMQKHRAGGAKKTSFFSFPRAGVGMQKHRAGGAKKTSGFIAQSCSSI